MSTSDRRGSDARVGKIILSVPQVPPGKEYHPGGQVTAANGLIDFLSRENVPYEVLNTIATVFPPVPIWRKFSQSVGRVFRACYLVRDPEVVGYLAFTGFGLSLYERFVIALIFRIFGKKSLIFFRSSEMGRHPPPLARALILRLTLRIPTLVVTQGTGLANQLRNIGRRDVEVVPNWLPPGYCAADKPKSFPADSVVQFVFVGWLEPTKGVPELIEATARLRAISHRFRLHLIGSGTLASEVMQEVSRRQLDNVLCYGWTEQKQVAAVLSRAHVFVLPSHSEGFPNSILEALAYGLPIISTRVGGIPDSVSHDVNGFLVDVGSPEQIATSMRRYLDDPALIPRHSHYSLVTVRGMHQRDVNCRMLLSLFRLSGNA